MEKRRSRFLGSLFGKGPGFAGAVWDKNDIAPTLTTMQGGLREPLIIEDFYYDVYNKRVKTTPVCGTVTTHPQDGHSGTFWVVEKMVDDLYAQREPRVFENIAPTLRSERQGLKVVEHEQKD